MEEENMRQALWKQLLVWLKDDLIVELFLFFVNSSQSSLEKLCKSSLFSFKKGKNKDQFLKWATQKLKTTKEGKKDNQGEEEFGHEQTSTLKTSLTSFLETLQIEDNKRDNLGSLVQQSLNRFLLQIEREKHRKSKEAILQNTIQKFTETFDKVMEIFQIQPKETWIKLILAHGSLEAMKLVNIKEEQERIKMQKALKFIAITESYNEISKNGGKDLKGIRNNMQTGLQDCLINLQLPIKLIEKIKRELLDKPLSNCMTKIKQLSEDTKSRYFSSEFYNSGILLEYAQVLSYCQTIHAKFMREVSQVIDIINENSKLNTDILKLVFELNFQGILSHPNVAAAKSEVYKKIKTDCPNYHKASKLLKHKKSTIQDFRTNQRNLKLLAMRGKFFEAGLRYQKWQQVQTELFKRNDSIINDLELNLEQKYILRVFFNEQIQPYFHREEKPLSYEEQMNQTLLNEIMYIPQYNSKSMDQINGFIDLVIKLQILQERYIDSGDLTQNQKKQLVNALKKNNSYLEYQKNRGIDEQQIQYQAKQKLKRLIYTLNLQHKIQVSYVSVKQLLDAFVNNKLRVPQQSKRYVCDLKQLKKRYLQEGQDTSIAERNTQYLIQLKQQKKQLISSFWRFLSKSFEDQSCIQEHRSKQFNQKQQQYAEYLLQANPFQNTKVNLSKIGITKAAASRNIEKEASGLFKKHGQIQKYLNQFQRLNKQIKQLSGEDQATNYQSPSKVSKNQSQFGSPSSDKFSPQKSNNDISPDLQRASSPRQSNSKQEQIKKIQSELSKIENQFLSNYAQLDKGEEKSYFYQNLLSKNQVNPKKLAQKILQANPFENPNTDLYENLKTQYSLRAAQRQNLKTEFKQIADKFGKTLANQYQQKLKELKALEA